MLIIDAFFKCLVEFISEGTSRAFFFGGRFIADSISLLFKSTQILFLLESVFIVSVFLSIYPPLLFSSHYSIYLHSNLYDLLLLPLGLVCSFFPNSLQFKVRLLI